MQCSVVGMHSGGNWSSDIYITLLSPGPRSSIITGQGQGGGWSDKNSPSH